MSLLDIRVYPDPVLRKRSETVSEFGANLHKLIDNMAETMYKADGVGLAAPQVGELLRVTVIDISSDSKHLLELVNPVIISKSGSEMSEEGCLSIPEYRESIERSSNIVVTAFNRRGEPFELRADGLLSRCIQHEIDHLDGVLFIDRLSRLKREMFSKWFKKRA